MNWKLIEHKDLSLVDAIKIANLKEQHWPHGIESQILWIVDNLEMDDYHLMGEEINNETIRLCSYITLSSVNVTIDCDTFNAFGIGCVCVDKSIMKKGLGKELVLEASRLISQEKREGILLCRESLLGFYEKCGWYRLNYRSAIVSNEQYNKCIMTLDKHNDCYQVCIDRNF